MKNKYIGRSKLSEGKFRGLVRCFCLDLDAVQTAAVIRLNRNTVNRYLRMFRERISAMCESKAPFGSPEVFESGVAGLNIPHFPGKCRPAVTGPPVFGALETKGRVFTEILPPPFQDNLKSALSRGVPLGCSVQPLRFRGYRALMYFGCDKPYSLAEDRSLSFLNDRGRVEPLWLFWLFARKRLSKFQGIAGGTFALHLKECEFRFNTRGTDMYTLMLTEFRKRPLGQCDANPVNGGEKRTFEALKSDMRVGSGTRVYRYFPEAALRRYSEA